MRKTPDPRTPLADLELFSHPAPSLFLHLNPYADLFFVKCSRIPHPLPRCSRPKPSKKTPPSSTRQQVLSWYSISQEMQRCSPQTALHPFLDHFPITQARPPHPRPTHRRHCHPQPLLPQKPHQMPPCTHPTHPLQSRNTQGHRCAPQRSPHIAGILRRSADSPKGMHLLRTRPLSQGGGGRQGRPAGVG